MQRALLNLGCGPHHHPHWINLDVQPGEDVIPCDLRAGIPFGDGVFDVVYHSHLLEHLPRPAAPGFLTECLRVLRPGGVLRVVVPDLEAMTRLYVQTLEAGLAGDQEAALRHDWLVVEMVDQLARHAPGGEMLAWWRQRPVPAEEFIVARLGREAREALAAIRSRPPVAPAPPPTDPAAVGAFRLSGECHLWMYDRLSLGRLLAAAGFVDVAVVAANASAIPEFVAYHLDTEPDGSVRKPDSLFMEARKPEPTRPA